MLGYVVRSLLVRLRNVAPAILSVSGVVAIAVVLFAAGQSLYTMIMNSGSEDLGLVIRERADYEAESSIDPSTFGRILEAPGIRRTEAGPRVSAELFAKLRVRRSDYTLETVEARGVEASALALRPGVRIVGGALPGPGQPGLIVGRLLVGKLPGLAPGKTLQVVRHEWPIVAILEAPGSPLEKEIWADRAALAAELGVSAHCSVVIFEPERREHIAKVAAFAAELGAAGPVDRRLTARSERGMSQKLLGRGVNFYLLAARTLVLVLLINLILATANTMYGAYLQRVAELAALRAIGFTRARVSTMLLQESLCLALLGAVGGIALAFIAHGRVFHLDVINTSFTIRITPSAAAVGLALALVTGVVGSVLAVVHAWRIDVLTALRDT